MHKRKLLVDTYVEGVGTVRDCLGCGALIAGGPTRCIRCAKEEDPRRAHWRVWLFWLRTGLWKTVMRANWRRLKRRFA
jgi:hypothetical protein